MSDTAQNANEPSKAQKAAATRAKNAARKRDDEQAEKKQFRADTLTVAEWVTGLGPEETERFMGIFQKYQSATVPTASAMLEYFGVDPRRIPVNNPFYTNGYITFRKENPELPGAYMQDAPTLHPYPEGSSYELFAAAHRYDTWGLE